jgi:hypothetical protein
MAIRTKFSAEQVRISKSLAILLELLIQEKVLSTTHLLARTAHPSFIFFVSVRASPSVEKNQDLAKCEKLTQ